MEILKQFNSIIRDFEFFTKVKADFQVKDAMSKKMNEYALLFKDYDTNIYSELINVTKEILDIFDKHINGKQHEAYGLLANLLERQKAKLYIHDLHYGSNINIYENSQSLLYKARILEWNSQIERKDIFHIPFSRRELVSTQRYSIPGVPCIYLSQSLHGAWEELERPNFDNTFVSRFEISKNFTVLDLGINYTDMMLLEGFSEEYSQETIKEIIDKFIITSLFKISCSISVGDGDRTFKSEYIMPQLLMLVSINSGFADGIRYSSNKCNSESYIHANYAFPATHSNGTEYDITLSNRMKLTQPVNIGLYNMFEIGQIRKTGYPENLFRRNTVMRITSDYPRLYSESRFYKLEEAMFNDNKLVLDGI